jgi:hypothetical protein
VRSKRQNICFDKSLENVNLRVLNQLRVTGIEYKCDG